MNQEMVQKRAFTNVRLMIAVVAAMLLMLAIPLTASAEDGWYSNGQGSSWLTANGYEVVVKDKILSEVYNDSVGFTGAILFKDIKAYTGEEEVLPTSIELQYSEQITAGRPHDGSWHTVPRADLKPTYKLTPNRWYNVRVTFADGGWWKFNCIIDALKPEAIPTVQYETSAGVWENYTASMLTNSNVRYKVNLPEPSQNGWNDTWPIKGHYGEARIAASTVASMPISDWGMISTRNFTEPDYTGVEGSITYGFRMVSAETGQAGAEKKIVVKIDQKAPEITTTPTTPVADGYTAYSKNPTWKFSDVNKVGSFSYDLYDFEGAYLRSGGSTNHNIGTVTFTENGIYKNVKVYDGAGNYTVLEDFSIDKSVPILASAPGVQRYAGVAGSPVDVTLSPTFAADEVTHEFRTEYASAPEGTWASIEGDGTGYTVYPKAGEQNTDKYYFRAVNVRSGLVSSVRSYTAKIAPGPLALFGGFPIQVEEGGSYPLGKLVNVSEIEAYANGVAAVSVKYNGNAFTGKFVNGRTYEVTLNYSGGTTVFTVNINTTKPTFVLSAVTASNNPYVKNTWVKENVKVTLTADHPDLSAKYYYSLDGGATWKLLTLANGVKTLSISCSVDAEVEIPYQFKAEATSGTVSTIQSYAVKIDKIIPTVADLTGSKNEGFDVYKGTVKITASEPTKCSYLFVPALGGDSELKELTNLAAARNFALEGEYTNIVLTDKAGNTVGAEGFVIAKAPVLVADVSEDGTTVTLSVTSALPANIFYEVYGTDGKNYVRLEGNTFTATEDKEYRFRATNTLSGAVSTVQKINLVPEPGPDPEVIAAAEEYARETAEALVEAKLHEYAHDKAWNGYGERNVFFPEEDADYINVPDEAKKDVAAYNAVFAFMEEFFQTAWGWGETESKVWAGYFAYGGVQADPYPWGEQYRNVDYTLIYNFLRGWAGESIQNQYYQSTYDEAFAQYMSEHS